MRRIMLEHMPHTDVRTQLTETVLTLQEETSPTDTCARVRQNDEMENEMAHGKSLENRYTNAPKKTYETITETGPGNPSASMFEEGGIFSMFGRPLTYRRPERVIRKRAQLEARRAAKARARANGKR